LAIRGRHAFVAMREPRAYRRALGLDEALLESLG
jgi:HD-GYP domain-containing protein (c-di-GMP phosphodiesterase class II)